MPTITRRYHPFVAGGSPFPLTAPTTTQEKVVVLTYPYISPSVSLTLRAPDFGNKYTNKQNRVFRKPRGGGSFLTFRDSEWPKYERLDYSISSITQSEAGLLQSFFNQSLGLEIGLLDFENRQWRGYIITPDGEISQTGIGCQFTGKFTFEGILA